MEQVLGTTDSATSLRSLVFKEPVTKDARPHLIAYIQELVAKAKDLSEEQLLSVDGHDIAMDICGALAYQSADGVNHDGWFNEKDEPLLYRMLEISGVLDVDPHHRDKWQRLFTLSEEIT